MNYSELRNYLVSASSIDTVKLFDAAVLVFEKYGITDYMDMFDAVAFDDPNADDTRTVDTLTVNLMAVITNLLVMQGLHVAETVLPSQQVEFADAMFMLVDYEDRDTVTHLMDAEMPVQELAAELLGLLTQYSVEELMGMFESVDENFARSLKNRLTEMKEEAPEEDLSALAPQMKAYAAYKGILNHEPIYSDKFYGHVGVMGMDFKTYLNLFQSDKEEQDLLVTDPRTVAKDLVGMAFLSCDGVDNPLIIIRKHLSDLFADINITTKIDVAVSKLTVEVAHAQA